MSRVRPTAADTNDNVAAAGNDTWIIAPALQKALVVPTGNIPVRLWLSRNGGTGANPMAFSHAFHRGVWSDFLDAIAQRRPPRITPRGALQTHYLIEAILASSAAGGVPVDVKR